ncbi:MAG: hypothetical protein FWF41_09695 [Betaproteobacteria bacterium]|nr:hypothetical protein [Betaproteobacteria bacterium]
MNGRFDESVLRSSTERAVFPALFLSTRRIESGITVGNVTFSRVSEKRLARQGLVVGRYQPLADGDNFCRPTRPVFSSRFRRRKKADSLHNPLFFVLCLLSSRS